MNSETEKQISYLRLDESKPIIIFDADEVLVHFAEPFSIFLEKYNHKLNLTGYRLDNAILDSETGKVAHKDVSRDLVWDFINQETISQPASKGAADALKLLNKKAQIIVLSNVPFAVYDDRVKNLKSLEMDFPLVSNEGPKGPAVKEILKNHNSSSFFIDDNPYQIESVYNNNKGTICVHFSVCDLIKPFMPKAVGATIKPDSWKDLVDQVSKCLK
jgi:hypothetical protein